MFLPVYGKNKMPDDPGVLLLAQKLGNKCRTIGIEKCVIGK